MGSNPTVPTVMNNPPKKVTAAKKGTARKSAIARLPAPQNSGKCVLCEQDTNAHMCVICAQEYSAFLDTIGNVGAPSLHALFKMYKVLMDRISDLENDLEIARIRKKYWDEG